MVTEILGVVKLVPVPTLAPPVEAVYHNKVPALLVAPRVRVPGPHLSSGVVKVMLGSSFTVATTATRGEVHVPSMASA